MSAGAVVYVDYTSSEEWVATHDALELGPGSWAVCDPITKVAMW